IVGERGPHRAHRGRMPDLTGDPSIGPHLAAGDLERLAQHRLREGSQTTEVEAEPAPALELILDLRRQVRGRVDANELPSDILAEPAFELGGRLAAHRRRDAEPIPQIGRASCRERGEVYG